MISQDFGQQQHQTQRLSITPQQGQSLRILQISAAELATEINTVLATNPLLEIDESAPTEAAPEEAFSEGKNDSADIRADAAADSYGDSGDACADPDPNFGGERAQRDNAEEADDYSDILQLENDRLLQRENVHLGEISDEHTDFDDRQLQRENDRRDEIADERHTADSADPDAEERRQRIFDNAEGAEPSLDAFLLAQAQDSGAPPPVLAALETLVGELDERGFLAADIGSLSLSTTHTRANLDAAWKLLKTFDPPGIGAANIRESFLIQLRRRKLHGTLSALIVDECFDLLKKRRFAQIAAALGVTSSEVNAAVPLLRTLVLAPARAFAPDENRILNPDLTVRRKADGDGWEVVFNDVGVPKLRFNQTYKSLLVPGKLKTADRDYIREKVADGRIFLAAVRQRKVTVERIACALVERQMEFFEGGQSKLRPLTIAQLAEDVGLHETTVGRAIANKSMRTPHGVFELRSFFSKGFGTAEGGVTRDGICRALTEIVARENPQKPFGDEQLCAELGKRGIRIARRTVAKYRDSINILPASQRTVAPELDPATNRLPDIPTAG
jgi:RNA polymerase sigma-54 factor